MRNHLPYRFLFIAALLAGMNGFSQITSTVTGIVTDRQTQKPLYGVDLMVRGTVLGASSDDRGAFIITSVPPGSYALEARMIGYESETRQIQVTPSQKVRVEMSLEPTVLVQPNVVVTASKRSQRIEDAPTTVNVVALEEIQMRNAATLDEVLQNTSGFRVIDGQIDLRGSTGFNWSAGSRVLLMVDGHPMINGDSGGINWDFIPPEEVDHVEVVKGAGSALYGSNAMAGMVNIITRDPSATPKSRIRLSYGVYDEPAYENWRWSPNFLSTQIRDGKLDLKNLLSFKAVDFSHSRRIGKIGLLGFVSRRTSTGYYENGDLSRWNVMLKSTVKLTPQSHLMITGNYGLNDHGDFLQWQTQSSPLTVPPEERGNSVWYEKGNCYATYRTAVNEHFAYTLKGNWYRTHWKNKFYDNHDFAMTDRFGTEGQMDLLFGQHTLTCGTEVVANFARSSIYSNQQMRDFALYGEDTWQFMSRVTFILGLRYDYHQVISVSSDQQLSPRTGLVWKPGRGTAVRMSLGRGFRAPSIAEVFANLKVSGVNVIPNPGLSKAERAVSLELGLNQTVDLRKIGMSYLGTGMVFDIALFQNKLANMIDVGYNYAKEGYQFMNMGRARIRGVEMTLNWAYNSHLTGQTGLTLLDPKNLDTGLTLNYRSKVQWVAGMNYKQGPVTVGWDYRYSSKYDEIIRVQGSEYDERVPMRVIDARIILNIFNTEIGLEGNNLLNYHYTLRQRFLEPVRHYILSLRREL